MKKISAFLLLFIFSGQWCFGKVVNETTAKTIGCNFLIGKGLQSLTPSDLPVIYTATSTINGKEVADFYVLAPATSKAFVMVAADDHIKPVLAYSTKSAFGTVNIPSHLMSWLNFYKKQIAYVIKNNVPARDGVSDQWNTLRTTSKSTIAAKTTAVSPLLSTLWNQEPYYNDYCPYDYYYDETTVTGCVATAMSQVMYYWQWPTVGVGSNSYDAYNPYDGVDYGTQTANFGATAYDWASMPLEVTSANDAVATLMYQVGVSVNMTYGPDGTGGSGANVEAVESIFPNCSEFALKNYFHYKRSLHGIFRSDVGYGTDTLTETQWVDSLKSEMNAGRPVLYTGFEGAGLAGHCWVCDGYDGSDNFHMNWGWDGLSDGYFSVDDLAPPALGAGGGDGNFNYNQAALIGIQPDSFPSATGSIALADFLNTSSSPVIYPGIFQITTEIYNGGSTTFSGDFRAEIFNESGILVDSTGLLTGETIAAGGTTSTLTFATPSAGLYDLMLGDYSIRIYYRPSSGTTWSAIANNGDYINYTTMSVLHNFSGDILMADSISAPKCTLISGKPYTANVDLFNPGYTGADFYGALDLSLYDPATGDLVFTIEQITDVDLAATGLSSTYTFTTSDLSVAPGTYVLALSDIPYDTYVSEFTGSYFYKYYSFPNPIMVQVGMASTATATAAGVTSICSGDSVLLNANTGTGLTYQWKRGVGTMSGATNASVEVTVSGYYEVVVTDTADGFCPTLSDSVHVVVTATVSPSVSISSSAGTTISSGESVTFTATPTHGGSSPSYQWFLNGTVVGGVTSNTYVTSALVDGDKVNCILHSDVPCPDTAYVASDTVTITVTEGINTVTKADNITLSPNPNKGVFTIAGILPTGVSEAELEVVNIIGDVVYKDHADVANGKINHVVNIADLPNGVYLLHVNTTETNKVIRFTINR